MSGIRGDDTSADQTLLNTLAHHFLKQPAKHLAKRRFPPPELRDGAVIRHAVKQIQPKIPPQRHVCLDALLNLPLRRDTIQKANQQILHQHHRVDGRTSEPFAVKWRGHFIHKRQVQNGLQLAQKVVRRNQIFYRKRMPLVLHCHPSVPPPLYHIGGRLGRLCQQLQNVREVRA